MIYFVRHGESEANQRERNGDSHDYLPILILGSGEESARASAFFFEKIGGYFNWNGL